MGYRFRLIFAEVEHEGDEDDCLSAIVACDGEIVDCQTDFDEERMISDVILREGDPEQFILDIEEEGVIVDHSQWEEF